MIDTENVSVFLGLDVGKGEHHACALDRSGRRLHDKPLPQDEQKLAELFARLGAHGQVLIVVDQPASIGALPVTVARAVGAQVAYLPGLAMRRIADTHPGSAKTDARDAYVIAEAARSMPHTLRPIDVSDEALANLEVIIGYDDDLAAEVNRVSNRIRGLLTQIHPALERVLGPKVTHPAVQELLIRYGGPTALGRTSPAQLNRAIAKHAPRSHARLVTAVKDALSQQTLVVPGTTAAEKVLPKLAATLRALLADRAQAGKDLEDMLDDHPLAQVLTSMPGIGVRTGARILLEVGDGSAFPTPGHLASYAGLAPVTRRSGSSIRGEHPPPSGNKHLKRALFLSAFAALHHPASRAYYDRKRAEGKKHNAALICLARRRVDVLHAMLRHGTTNHSRLPAAA